MGDTLSIETLTDAELAHWLETRYVPAAVDSVLADPQRSVVAISYGGCGLSTSLSLLRSKGLLTFPYNPEYWPGEAHALSQEPTHFGQWMSHIADRFVRELRARPEILGELSDLQLEFLIWLSRRYLVSRQSTIFRRFLSTALPPPVWQELNAKIERGELDELYGTSTLDVQSQIDECLEVAGLLGWRGIYACVDLHPGDWIALAPDARDRLRASLVSLLGTLTPLQRTGLGFKAGIPETVLEEEAVDKLVRGRVALTAYAWSDEALLAIGACEPALRPEWREGLVWAWRALSADVHAIWGKPGPAAACIIARLVANHGADERLPERLADLRAALYRQGARLRLDGDPNERRVWRGMHPIKLDETPYRFLERLWQRRGGFVGRDELLSLAGSPDSLDQNISRVRKSIEPLAAQKCWIYLHRNQTDGAWLDKNVCVFR